MRETSPPAALVQNDGEKPGGDRCAELTAGSEAGSRRDISSIAVDMESSTDAVAWESGTGLGSSDPTKIVEKSYRGDLIKLTNLGATSRFRKKSGRASRKSSRQLLGTDVQVDGFEARALLDPVCESELVLSDRFSTQCEMHSQVDEEKLVEFADGTSVPSTSIDNVHLSVSGASHPVRGCRGVGCVRDNPLKALVYNIQPNRELETASAEISY
jgi:hypothetical protein